MSSPPNKPILLSDNPRRELLVQLRISYDPTRFSAHPQHLDWNALLGVSPASMTVLSAACPALTDAACPSIGEITPAILYTILFGDIDHPLPPPRLIAKNDYPIHRVRVLPYYLGKLIRDADPGEQFFHVELDPPDRSELWSTKSWKESLTKRLRHARPDDDVNSILTVKHRLLYDMSHYLSAKLRMPVEKCQMLVDTLMHFGAGYDGLLETFEIPDNLRRRLFKYREQLAETPTPTEPHHDLPANSD